MRPGEPDGPGEPAEPPPPNTPPAAESWDLLSRAFRLLGVGTVFVLLLAACVGLGWFVDAELSTTPLFTLLGVALGIVLGVVTTVAEIRRDL